MMQEVKWHFYPSVAADQNARSFIERLFLEGLGEKTVDAYARAVDSLLLAFMGADPSSYVEADEGDMLAYLKSLKKRAPRKRGRGGLCSDLGEDGTNAKVRHLSGRCLSDSTIAQQVVAIRRFYDFLIRRRVRSDPDNPMPRGSRGFGNERPRRGMQGKRNKRLPWTPPDDVWERFMVHVIEHESARDRAMILLAYYGALRREELMSLRYDDIDWSRSLLILRPETTKSGAMRHIPISGFVERVLRNYIDGHRQDLLDEYGGDRNGPIFLSESYNNPGLPLSVPAFNAIVQKLRDKLGIPLMTPHTLRHQRCTILKRAQVDLEDIALIAGHASTETTRIYVHIAPTELGKAIEEATAPFDAKIRAAIKEYVDE